MPRHDDDESTRRRGDRWSRRPPEEDGDEEWYEPRVMEFAKKIVRQGAEVVWTTQGALRDKASGVRNREIPRELVESVAHMTTRTKDELVGLMAREFKNYLEKMDLAGELRKVAENYTLDVKMKIRLTPNEDYDGPRIPADEGAVDRRARGAGGAASADRSASPEPGSDAEAELEDDDGAEDELESGVESGFEDDDEVESGADRGD